MSSKCSFYSALSDGIFLLLLGIGTASALHLSLRPAVAPKLTKVTTELSVRGKSQKSECNNTVRNASRIIKHVFYWLQPQSKEDCATTLQEWTTVCTTKDDYKSSLVLRSRSPRLCSRLLHSFTSSASLWVRVTATMYKSLLTDQLTIYNHAKATLIFRPGNFSVAPK